MAWLFPCKPVVLHPVLPDQGMEEVPTVPHTPPSLAPVSTRSVLQAAWCSALRQSRTGGPVLNRPLTNLCAPFHSLFLFSILLLPEQISVSSSPSPSLLLHPRPVVPSPSPSLPTSTPEDSLSQIEKRREGGDLETWAPDKLVNPASYKDTAGLVRAESRKFKKRRSWN